MFSEDYPFQRTSQARWIVSYDTSRRAHGRLGTVGAAQGDEYGGALRAMSAIFQTLRVWSNGLPARRTGASGWSRSRDPRRRRLERAKSSLASVEDRVSSLGQETGAARFPEVVIARSADRSREHSCR